MFICVCLIFCHYFSLYYFTGTFGCFMCEEFNRKFRRRACYMVRCLPAASASKLEESMQSIFACSRCRDLHIILLPRLASISPFSRRLCSRNELMCLILASCSGDMPAMPFSRSPCFHFQFLWHLNFLMNTWRSISSLATSSLNL